MYFDEYGNEFETAEDAKEYKKKEFDKLSFLEKMKLVIENDKLSVDKIADWINAEGLTKNFYEYFIEVFKDMKNDYADDFVEWCLEWEDD